MCFVYSSFRVFMKLIFSDKLSPLANQIEKCITFAFSISGCGKSIQKNKIVNIDNIYLAENALNSIYKIRIHFNPSKFLCFLFLSF